MNVSEKFCLQWDDFQENIVSSLKDVYETKDFQDVTLVCEDAKIIEAHRVILSSCSPFFQNVLRQLKSPQPMIYMKGIKSSTLTSIMEFIYKGESSVLEDNLANVLSVADDLQIKGLTQSPKHDGSDLQMFQEASNGHESDKSQDNFTDFDDSEPEPEPEAELEPEFTEADIIDLETTYKEEITTRKTKRKENVEGQSNDELDQTIYSMMEKTDNMWHCTRCDKTDKQKGNMKNHIEGKHLEGVTHPCQQCDRKFRTRISLAMHKSANHTDIQVKGQTSKYEITNTLKFQEGFNGNKSNNGEDDSTDHVDSQHLPDEAHINNLETSIRENDATMKTVHLINKQSNEELDQTIYSMMEKTGNLWKCTQCDKTDKVKGNLKNHIEGKHIEGISHPCQQCDKQFRSRISLASHKYNAHNKL